MVLYSCFYPAKLKITFVPYRTVLCATESVCVCIYIKTERDKQGTFQRNSRCSAMLPNPSKDLKSAVISRIFNFSFPLILLLQLKYFM